MKLKEDLVEELAEARQREEILRKTAEQYRQFVEYANSIILQFDMEGKITFLNEFGLTLFGCSRDELIGKPLVGSIVPPPESSGRYVDNLIESIMRNPEKHVVSENENMRKDGSRLWVLWTNRAIPDEEGKTAEIISIGNDITARKEAEELVLSASRKLEEKVRERTSELRKVCDYLRYEIVERKVTEEALRESEASYRSIVEGAVEGIFQISEDGKCIMANPALAEMLGYDSPEELKASLTDVQRQLYVNRQDYEDFVECIRTTGVAKAFETQFCRPDGKTIWVSMNVRAVHDVRGSFICYEGTVEDVTLRKMSEEQLEDNMVKLKRIMEGTIKALSVTTEMRDPYTAGHQMRVARLATAIAKEMALTEEHIRVIRIAASIHDIGKIYVPAEILTRPGKISSNELAVLRDHSVAGYEILKDIEFGSPIAEIVLQHHERMNGTGYPKGLSGDATSIDAKIIAVADVVESMMSHRPYRPSLGLEKALDEIRKNRGVFYDEAVVDACLRIFDEKRFSFDAEGSL